MKHLLFFIAIVFALAACKQDPKQEATEESVTTESTTAPEPEPTPTGEILLTSGTGKLKLMCEKLSNSGGIPSNAIFAIVDERKTKIMNIRAACMEIAPKDYSTYGIPSNATAVIGSWFAGLGDYFYAKNEGNNIVVYYSAIPEEGPAGGIHTYHKVATYENGKVTVHELKDDY